VSIAKIFFQLGHISNFGSFCVAIKKELIFGRVSIAKNISQLGHISIFGSQCIAIKYSQIN
jgi:hypothetical protein